MLAGPFTAAPLILYANGAKLLRYSTIGLMQYLTPTMIFLIALFVFREPFSLARARRLRLHLGGAGGLLLVAAAAAPATSGDGPHRNLLTGVR